MEGTHWVPAEVDVSIRPGWFYHETQDSLVKNPQQLLDIYYSSVGRNSNLLLNVPPDRRGLINEKDIETLMKFKELIDAEFESELARGKNVKVSDIWSSRYNGMMITDGNPDTFWTPSENIFTGTIEIDLVDKTELNRLLIQEYIELGQHIMEFSIEAMIEGSWCEISSGTTIGNKVIKKFPLILSDRIRVNIIESKARPSISNIEIYKAPGD